MRLALAQINSVVGDLDGNTDRILDGSTAAREASADLVLFPELAVTGYPPEDLLLRPGFIRAARRHVETIAHATHGLTALVGAPHLDADLYNACFVLARGEVAGRVPEALPPELRRLRRGSLLRAGRRPRPPRGSASVVVGPTICEDVWQPGPPATELGAGGRATRDEHLGVAVPRRQGPRARGDAAGARPRQRRASSRSATRSAARTSSIFDGHSVVLDDEGEVLARAKAASRRSCSSSTSTRPRPSRAASETFGGARSPASAGTAARRR